MPGLTQGTLLQSVRLNKIVNRLAAELDVIRPLNFLDMLPLVPALDGELTGRFTGKIIAADIIADNQKAVVQQSQKLDIVRFDAPNIKIGYELGQKDLNRMFALMKGTYAQVQGGQNALRDWDKDIAMIVFRGVRERMNAIACGMMIDSLAYNRLGVQFANVTWGMPSSFKVTAAVAWTSPTTATPITDLLGLDTVTRVSYGRVFNKYTMSTADFMLMAATTQFANLATFNVGVPAAFLVTPAALKTMDTPSMMLLAGKILGGKTIVLDDTTYWEKNADGTETQKRALPLGKVLMTRTEDEKDGSVWDMGNGVVTESMVSDLVGGGMIGGSIGGEAFGPISYYTSKNVDLNEPGAIAWAVARAWPRRYVPEASAVLTVR
jgi:hypothetical protein